MVALAALWLPILLSAVFVFIASSLIHMVLPYHRSDYRRFPDEDKLRVTIRAAGVQPGLYHFPYCTHKEMNTPAQQEKFKEGPNGLLVVMPSGVPAMPKFLAQWFVYCLLASFVIGYLAAHTMGAGAPWRAVFRIVGTAAFLVYGLSNFVNVIWKGNPWSNTIKDIFDGIVYAAVTAATFGFLWPH